MTDPRPANPPQPATETRSDTRMTDMTHNADSHTQPTGETETMTDANARPKLERGRLAQCDFRFVPYESAVDPMERERVLARLEKTRADYLEKREQLKGAAENEATIAKMKAAAERQRDEASQNWQREFRENMGAQSKSLRSQCKAEREWQLEAEQQTEMLERIKPQMEWMRLQTQLAREAFSRALRHARKADNQSALFDAMESLFDSPQGETVASRLQTLRSRIEADLCNDIPYMWAAFGADVGTQPGPDIKHHMSPDQRATLANEVERCYLAALGEMVVAAVPKGIEPVSDETLSGLAPLNCEDGRNIYETHIGRVRRVNELQAELQIPH
ncbi:hypothetical protein [Salinicola lusitanus]|uniref:hypothetical protein n=1 Tax=Salinicola lusitanus TaxID=1949085 RepID=UPI000DA177B0|nr:hypothetical protein [Salinicola lusitanus]